MIRNIDIEKFVVMLRDLIILIVVLVFLYILLFKDRLAFTIAGSLITISSQWLLARSGRKQEQKKIATFLTTIIDNQVNRLFMIEGQLMSVNNNKANLESVKNYCEKCKPEMEFDYQNLLNKTEIYALDIAGEIVLYLNRVNQFFDYICSLKPDDRGDIQQALITIRSYWIEGYSNAMNLNQQVVINEIIFNNCVSRLKVEYQRLSRLKCRHEKQGLDSDCESLAMEQIEKLFKDFGIPN
ncbi:MAG TPA: hypothetical protein DDW76_07420 [Cyanobacteria bacterium UBA11369]|nr:hypothetical protein [Cyanobacteria bacterium UBA11371]HBE21219.1 hypothetical protein [Cyanobacteria bacterium UBA11367]HBE35207.1 hypothetical protein [Cyanobacteria bacterium UBA11368]HBE48615.1 hypothetical protein [Cyanobacteria bacterium UBA11369]